MTKFLTAKYTVLISVFLTFGLTANAQTVAQTNAEAKSDQTKTSAVTTNDETQNRVRQLEEQMKIMQAQLDALKRLVNQNQTPTIAAQTETKPATETIAAKTENKTTETTAAPIKTETKQSSPPRQKPLGVDIGAARLVPYGTIYFNAFGNSAGTNNADVPLFATPTGSSDASGSLRQTRLGFRLEGARVGNANLKAVLEADFFGGIPNIGIGENFGVVRLRLANARLDWEKTSLTVGQDWMVFAPVNPTSLAAAAIPQMAAAGNSWARLPQIKIERKLGKNFSFQSAILAPQTGDYNTASNFFLQPTSGAASKLPFFQSRLAFAETNWFKSKKAGGIGLSGHYGRSKVFTGATSNIENDIESAALALDWNFPLAERVRLAGEAFFGRNLGGFQAGVFQSYNNDFAYRAGATVIPGGVRSIGTRGGWAQLGFTPDAFKDNLSLYASIGIDDPADADLTSRAPRDFRRQNFSFAFETIYKLTAQIQIGGGFSRLQTLYVLSGRRNANHVNLSAAYSF